ncbi:uncharacterized protein RAG0_09856 [Rhynchosporium agropyri]|uniref:Uncharacterized protein n=1 Tax=Rhynchosporium agropyri TaxID=914238 RepID=A0A1E1KXA9_9HELO|nr:uncharacterized protein RAG0_09856 [Rhynchosporium agropyri]
MRGRTTHLKKIDVGYTDPDSLSSWSSVEPNSVGGDREMEDFGVGVGVRVVVLGDSWVEDRVEEGAGRSWVEFVCELLSCSSHLNFASSRHSSSSFPSSYPSQEPRGVKTSNKIRSLLQNSHSSTPPTTHTTLPDLSTQIQTYLSLPRPSQKPSETLFIISLGFWDIYHLSALPFPFAQDGVALASIIQRIPKKRTENLVTEEEEHERRRMFRVIVPKVLDPSLTPGWVENRLVKSSARERDGGVGWINNVFSVVSSSTSGIHDMPKEVEEKKASNDQETIPRSIEGEKQTAIWDPHPQTQTQTHSPTTTNPTSNTHPIPEKDTFIPDIPAYILSTIHENPLQDTSQVENTGLGAGESAINSVKTPCFSSTYTAGAAETREEEEEEERRICR